MAHARVMHAQSRELTNSPHAVVKAARPQPALGNLKASALPQQHVACWHPHILHTSQPFNSLQSMIRAALHLCGEQVCRLCGEQLCTLCWEQLCTCMGSNYADCATRRPNSCSNDISAGQQHYRQSVAKARLCCLVIEEHDAINSVH